MSTAMDLKELYHVPKHLTATFEKLKDISARVGTVKNNWDVVADLYKDKQLRGKSCTGFKNEKIASFGS